MRVAAVLSPVADATAVIEAAEAADRLGLDGVGLWDHYHSARPEWAYVCGWSAFGAIAARTRHVRLTPMVLNNLHYQPGVLAKESSVLAGLSGGRFELGIGAGDWPDSFAAWGERFPDRSERLERLEETVDALRALWAGEAVHRAGSHVRLHGAISTPAPPRPPRVVVGVGGSRRTLEAAAGFADELNVYTSDGMIELAREAAARATRPVTVSVFVSWEWDKWPSDPAAELAALAARGAERAFVSIGAADMVARLETLAAIAASDGPRTGRHG